MLLGINIDHVATVRQARGEIFPDPVEAAHEAIRAGATGITAHLREDRRHIQDDDIFRLKKELKAPLNMEMAATAEIIGIAADVKPAWVCLVPEKRLERTTEGGLDMVRDARALAAAVKRLKPNGTRVSMFIEPTLESVEASKAIGADAVELHTGLYAKFFKSKDARLSEEMDRIKRAAAKAAEVGLVVNAGHGIDYANISKLMSIYSFHELNIGYAIIARALFVGLAQAVKEMKERMK